MEITVENVTPAKATSWLNKNKSNRNMRDGVAEKYAEDMRKGRWTNCPEPISFYEDGELADGQHRLWAIVDSGMAQKFPIARGLKRADGLNINTGLTRTLVDNGRISGLDTGLSNELLSVSRAIHQGKASSRGNSLSNAHRLEMLNEHREASEWVCANGPKGRGLRNSTIMAAIARAWYYEEDKEALKRFAYVFSTGFAEGEHESAAISLRNYFLSKKGLLTSQLWTDTFLKAQTAIWYFVRKKRLTVVKKTSTEIYPLKRKKARK